MKPPPWKAGRNLYVKRPKRRLPRVGSLRALAIELLRIGPRSSAELASLCRTSRDGINTNMLTMEERGLVVRLQSAPRAPVKWALATAKRTAAPQGMAR